MKPRCGQAGGFEPFARQEFVARGGDGFRRTETQVQTFRDLRGDKSRPIAHGGDSVKGPARGEFRKRGERIFEAHGDGIVSPGIAEHVTAIGGEDQIDPEPASGVGKGVHLITGGGGEQDDAPEFYFWRIHDRKTTLSF